jgi:hypothetical protein
MTPLKRPGRPHPYYRLDVSFLWRFCIPKEVRQDVFAHQFVLFELLVFLHLGPADPKDEEVTIEAIDAPFELLDNVFGAPEDEAEARTDTPL